jgi:hypothetical protein
VGVSPATLRRIISKPPFDRTCRRVGDKKLKLTLLRVLGPGEEPAKKDDNDYRRIMASIWKKKTGKIATKKEQSCLWGLSGELPDGLSVKVFEYAINDWSTVMASVKEVMLQLVESHDPDGVIHYFEFPSITVIRRFWKEAHDAYLMHLQWTASAPVDSWESYKAA